MHRPNAKQQTPLGTLRRNFWGTQADGRPLKAGSTPRFHWKIALGVSPGTVLPFYGKTVTPYKQALRTLSGVVLSPVLQKVSRRNFYGSAPPGSKGVWLCFL